MTAASDRREELEAFLWREGVPASLVPLVLIAADAYAKAGRPRARKKPAAPGSRRAVHYAPEGAKHPACQAHDFPASRNWALTADRLDVTCQRCPKSLRWQEAGESP